MSIDFQNYSQMQQYYIQKQLPEFSSLKEVQRQKKDHNYYNDNFNIWNNRAQTANKNYAFYHQQVDQGKQIVDKMKDREVVDRFIQEEQRKQYILMQKQIDKERLQMRKRERFALQLESMQDIVSKDPREVNSFIEMTTATGASLLQSQSTNNLVNNKSSAKQNQNPLLGRAPHQWNKLNQTSKKYIDQAINLKIIQKDEEAVHQITKRIEKDYEVQNLKKQSFDKIYEQTRTSFLNSHQKNVEFEKKCGLIQKEKPIVIIQSKVNRQTIKPLMSKIINSNSEKQLYLHQSQQSQQYYNTNNERQYNEKRNQELYQDNAIEDQYNKYEEAAQGITPKSEQHEVTGSARNNLESSQQAQRKGKSLQGILSSNTNNIHKQLQYSSLPYQENTDQIKEDDIVIQYNNKNNQQSKQQVDQINFGDEKEGKVKQNTYRRKSSLAKQSELSEIPSILKGNVQGMPVNAKSQRVNSFHAQPKLTGQYLHSQNQLDQYHTDREFLTSAESHAKKQVNFQPSQQENVQFLENNYTSANASQFTQKNMEDVKPPQGQVKFRKIDELAQPKIEFQPKEFLERSEYKGLLTTELNNINVNSDTEFARTMMMNSQIVNSKIYNSQRPSTRQSKISKITQTNSNTFSFVRPSTTASGTRSIIFKNPQNISTANIEINDLQIPPQLQSSNSCSNSTLNRIYSLKNIHKLNAESTLNIDLKNELLSEIDTFEKKYQFVKENRVGFSKSNLMKFQQKETFMSAKSALGQK